jgi:very-short-patch-repair endonuclease
MPRGEHFTREHQRRARRAVSSESCARNGSKGAKVTLARYGADSLFNHWRRWKLNHSSLNELVMIGILARLGIVADREWRLGETLLSVDFYLPQFDCAIEIHGSIHHKFEEEKRRRRDQRKRQWLADAGINCLWINYLEFCDVAALIRRVERFVKEAQLESAA